MGVPFIEIGTTERGSAASEEGDKYSLGWLHFLSHGGGTIRTISLENGPLGPSPIKMLEFQIRNY